MTTQPSPRRVARLAGLLYLVAIICGSFAEGFVRMRLLVSDDAATTASNILGHEQLYRLGFVADLIPLLCYMILAVIFYALFNSVNRYAAALVVFFNLVGSTIQAAILLLHLAALTLIKGGRALSAIDEPQRQALAYLCLNLQGTGYTIALVFFACFSVCMGYLILRSSFLPRFLGVLMVIGGLSSLTNGMLFFLAPSLASGILLMPSLLAELSLTLWLLIVGVNEPKWRGQAGAAAVAQGA